MSWFKSQVNLGNVIAILGLVFIAGGVWYVVPEKINAIDTDFDNHIEYQYRPIRDQVQSNTSRLINLESNYEALRDLINEQRNNDAERYNRIEQRLDYIINRLDED